MTKLSPEQDQLLAAVVDAKKQADADIAHRRANFEEGVEKDKAPIYDAVAQAVWAGVPARRLGAAIGSSDHKTIKSYFPPEQGMTIRNEGQGN